MSTKLASKTIRKFIWSIKWAKMLANSKMFWELPTTIVIKKSLSPRRRASEREKRLHFPKSPRARLILSSHLGLTQTSNCRSMMRQSLRARLIFLSRLNLTKTSSCGQIKRKSLKPRWKSTVSRKKIRYKKHWLISKAKATYQWKRRKNRNDQPSNVSSENLSSAWRRRALYVLA